MLSLFSSEPRPSHRNRIVLKGRGRAWLARGTHCASLADLGKPVDRGCQLDHHNCMHILRLPLHAARHSAIRTGRERHALVLPYSLQSVVE